ncbi:type II toxin-antitoxin system VapC family toxin [Jiangella ureilytica]|uniref:Ribonuclease VapC n=1 Tax=Jiangella ureilytica TaxID=2530374 RepID=A0A4R4RPW1_9ACTN|nr:type II toxin-antitoxin system VapC family toxin [Jiangella ureilytica]TDC51908.1 type II toxin-antitoxin system VapC family toxin [Jiangella ureilytica]
MTYLIDTNVISELISASPDRRVESWLRGVDEDALLVSAITLGELRFGIELLPAGRKRDRLESWMADEFLPRFEDRVLTVTAAVADMWGRIKASARSAGRQLTPADGLIAATAFSHGLVLVTRNTADFRTTGVELLNPWHEDV